MPRQLIIQHQRSTLYAGEGTIGQWEDRLFKATSKAPDKPRYDLIEVTYDSADFTIKTMSIYRDGSGSYVDSGINRIRFDVDDRSRNLLLELLSGEKQ